MLQDAQLSMLDQRSKAPKSFRGHQALLKQPSWKPAMVQEWGLECAVMRLACNATGMANAATAKCCRRLERAMAQMDSKLESSGNSGEAAGSGILS